MINALATRGASFFWSLASALARAAVPSTRLPVRVVSVGNIQAGGAGKTPLVALIARQANERGIKACILTRGYGGNWERLGGVIAAGDAAPNPADCGDEPALLHDLAPEADIGVGADRVRQFAAVVARAEEEGRAAPRLVILDDGFQHHRIKKDLEIVAVTSASRDAQVHRDFVSVLSRADLVVWTKGDREPDMRGRPRARVRLALEKVQGNPKIWLVSGVADGEQVLRSSQEAGYVVATHHSFRDHAIYGRDEVSALMTEARAAGCSIALTGKDWVKWRMLGVSRQDVRVLEPSVELIEGQAEWMRLLWG